MEQLFNQMGEFLKMDTDLPFPEFHKYHQEVVAYLQAEFANLDKDQLIKMAGICNILHINATSRSMQKDANAKKFKKMAEKAQFWYNAIGYKIVKEHNMTAKELEDAVEALWED